MLQKCVCGGCGGGGATLNREGVLISTFVWYCLVYSSY